jgi:hypothetical protein
MATITGANSTFYLSIDTIFPIAQELQGFAVDDLMDTDAIERVETKMGVDGILSAGRVNVPVKTTIALMADSASIDLFEQWVAYEASVNDVYFANGTISQDSIGRRYTLTNGVLTSYPTMANIKKLLGERKMIITWESVTGSTY